MSLIKTLKDSLNNIIYPATHAKAVFVETGNNTHTDLQNYLDNQDFSLDPTGSATKGIYIDNNGDPQAMTYAVNKDVPSDAVFTDTTYESKTAASGGAAVSLCTTGEKYDWNSKLSKAVLDINPTSATISAYATGTMWVETE